MTRTCFLAVSMLSISAYAETGATPDWTGYYMLARDRDAAGLNIISPDFGKTVADHLQPWAKLKMEETNGIADDTGAVCMPAGIGTATRSGTGRAIRWSSIRSGSMTSPG